MDTTSFLKAKSKFYKTHLLNNNAHIVSNHGYSRYEIKINADLTRGKKVIMVLSVDHFSYTPILGVEYHSGYHSYACDSYNIKSCNIHDGLINGIKRSSIGIIDPDIIINYFICFKIISQCIVFNIN